MVSSTEGLTQARENLPAATALISRKLPVAKESESPFRSFGLAVSESLSAFPKHESVWRTPSAAFHDSDERELSYKAAANSKKPLARWMPELYLLMVILLPKILFTTKIPNDTKSGQQKGHRKGALSSFVLRGRIHFSKTSSRT